MVLKKKKKKRKSEWLEKVCGLGDWRVYDGFGELIE